MLTLTGDVGRVLSKLHDVEPSGNINFLSSVRIAQVCSWFEDSHTAQCETKQVDNLSNFIVAQYSA